MKKKLTETVKTNNDKHLKDFAQYWDSKIRIGDLKRKKERYLHKQEEAEKIIREIIGTIKSIDREIELYEKIVKKYLESYKENR